MRAEPTRGVLARVGRYWHTIRYLRPVQLYGRIAYRISRPRAELGPAPAVRPVASDAWTASASHVSSMRGPERFRFLNEERDLASCGWDDPRVDRLWRYNLHYFADLTADDAGARLSWHHALVDRWIRDNPPGAPTAWEPYPTSLRIVNWIKWALGGAELSNAAIHSLAVQTRWLVRRLEHHLLGNHLFANAKALLFAGLFFDGAEANAWRALATRILTREIPEQILQDGGHFERSTMYHALALEDMLDLYNVITTFGVADTRPLADAIVARLGPMREWASTMTHPDGEIAFFNDAAMGIAPSPAALDAYARRLGLASITPADTRLLDASGYARAERGAAVALIDVAPVGPDYLPAHAHADTLSFELSLFGHRVFVNSGTSRYGDGPERTQERGTASHNTVVVDGADSSEVWGGFRVARRARPFGLEFDPAAVVTVACAHDGYRRLPGRVDHHRTWRLSDTSLVVDDVIAGAFSGAEAHFHLHPAVRVAQVRVVGDSTRVELTLADGRRAQVEVQGGTARIDAATWHPEFGRSDATQCIVVTFAGTTLRTSVTWSGDA